MSQANQQFGSTAAMNVEMKQVPDDVIPSTLPRTRIKPSEGWSALELGELWHHRELLYFFVWRDVKIRYKQTVMGTSWAVIQPFFTMVVFSLFFGRLAGIPSDGFPYPIFSYAALVPWTYFANSVSLASNSLVNNANMVSKIYFPRLILPSAAVIAGLVDFVLAFIVLMGMMLFYRILPTSNVVWLPVFLLIAVITSLGVSFWFAAMNVQFRDIRYVLPFLMQIWMYATPIAYPASLIPEQWRMLYGLNPMVGVIEGFRWALLGSGSAPGATFGVSALMSVALLVSGAFYFRRLERTFADVV